MRLIDKGKIQDIRRNSNRRMLTRKQNTKRLK